MSKIVKRIRKVLIKNGNILVLGQAWGILSELPGIYDTVFVIDETHPGIRARNLVYKNFDTQISHLPQIHAVIIDRNHVDKIDKLGPLISATSPQVAIEGNEVIPRTQSKLFFENHYNNVSQHGFFHVWRKQ